MDFDYDESSQEVVTTIAMIKSMTTTARRKSSVAKSPKLPQISNGKRGSQSKNVFATNNTTTLRDTSKSPSFHSWSTRGVALAKIEFKRRLEKSKINPPQVNHLQADETKRLSITERTFLNEKESQRFTLLRSIFPAGEDKTKTNSGPAGTDSNPQKKSSPSRNVGFRQKPNAKAIKTTKNASQSALPMLQIVKITPQCRPMFHQGTKANNAK